MKEHKHKMIAPICITVIMLLYYALYFGILMALIESVIIKLLVGIIPLALSGVMIYICIQRIQEIKGGEEDDLSKY